MTSIVTYEAGLRTVATHLLSGNSVITDAPPDNHGKGQAFSPTDMCATSLAACMLTVMGIYAEKNNIELHGAKAEVTKVMAVNPRRISKVKVDLFLPPSIHVEERKKLENIGLNCPVTKSLHPEIEQDITFHYVDF